MGRLMKVYDEGRSIIFDYQVSSKSVLLFEGWIIMAESDNGLEENDIASV
jgi:hypothetical protein